MDLRRRKHAKTASGVPADGPQTTETRKNGVWGASGWTSNDGKRVKALFVEQGESISGRLPLDKVQAGEIGLSFESDDYGQRQDLSEAVVQCKFS